ncbi:phosphatase PAP2 family protein [Nucisporomicrobium flavum]|uniref:phosphatase PAP2 family protein n=1 Tax=Nucisporomicrobium flavum TaxID=2785915 RepID=UPI003C2F84ED
MTVQRPARRPDDRARRGGTAALVVAGCSATAFVLLALLISGKARPMLQIDTWLSRSAHAAALAHPGWRSAMAAVTVTGSTAVLTPLTALGCAILLAFRRWRQAVFAAVAMVVVVCARLVVVAVIARPRPADQLAPASNYSFPSGHSTASAAAALIAVLVCWPLLPRRWSRMMLAATAGFWAVAVGVSRVALVVHWPSDVLGAWLFVVAVVPATGVLLRAVPGRDERPLSGCSPPSPDG